jgi:hypothetical protein
MDPETFRLLISTAGVVVSGLGGALMTAHFNGKNAERTHEAQRKMWTLEQNHARQESQRIQKEDDYRNLLLSLDAYQLLLTRAFTADPILLDRQEAIEAERKFKAAAAHVTLFNDDPQLEDAINGAAWELSYVVEQIEEAMKQQVSPVLTPQNLTALVALHRTNILTAMRKDLRATASSPASR